MLNRFKIKTILIFELVKFSRCSIKLIKFKYVYVHFKGNIHLLNKINEVYRIILIKCDKAE